MTTNTSIYCDLPAFILFQGAILLKINRGFGKPATVVVVVVVVARLLASLRAEPELVFL